MKGSHKDIEKVDTWSITLMELVERYGKPVQRKEIYKLLKKQGIDIPKHNAGVYLYNATKEGYLKILRYPRMYPFYCHPKWLNELGCLEEYSFDPITKEFKRNEPTQK